uniref:Nudix hydrolase domain-containing protein n=1 Tax=Palpitomonas bilix TaxID=652834 RepID=A0A7S3GLX6_9EUKA|mmetsp:Transcript_9166/g.24841  ORF Transcript_9166/g.24841 Transcript_9166/m.24841 type:complete len:308 (+) Transcript_9166:186-1109(+)
MKNSVRNTNGPEAADGDDEVDVLTAMVGKAQIGKKLVYQSKPGVCLIPPVKSIDGRGHTTNGAIMAEEQRAKAYLDKIMPGVLPKVRLGGKLKLNEGNGFCMILGTKRELLALVDGAGDRSADLTSRETHVADIENDRLVVRKKRGKQKGGDAGGSLVAVKCSLLSKPNLGVLERSQFRKRTLRIKFGIVVPERKEEPECIKLILNLPTAVPLRGAASPVVCDVLEKYEELWKEETHMLLLVTSYDDGCVVDYPGGKRQLGETARECAERECKEETGIVLEKSCEYLGEVQMNMHKWCYYRPRCLDA